MRTTVLKIDRWISAERIVGNASAMTRDLAHVLSHSTPFICLKTGSVDYSTA